MKFDQPDCIVCSFVDMKRLFLRCYKKIQLAMVLLGFFVFFSLLLRTPCYEIEATFKQSSKQGDIASNMKKMVQQFIPLSTESGTIAIMQSNEVLSRAVEKLGMQISCHSNLLEKFQKIGNTFFAEFGNSITDSKKFSFSHVSYSGEKVLPLFLVLKDKTTYQLLDEKKQVLGEKKLGESISFPLGGLTLNSIGENAQIGLFYKISVEPLFQTLKRVKAKLKISPHKLDKTILQLTFFYPNRVLGTQFLNQLMFFYQAYLKQENDEICQSQLHYLDKRQQELMHYYDEALQAHAFYLKENLENNGFIGFAQEITTLSEPKNFYTSKLFDVDLELGRLSESKKETENLPEELSQIKNKLGFESNFDEFAGLNLTTAQALLAEYTRERDAFQAQIKELIFLREQLARPGFELSSLGGVVDDGVIRDLVNKASGIALQLEDENNRSSKEQERLMETLHSQKKFLTHYLLQTIQLKKLRLKLLGEKVDFLQQTTLSLLQAEKELLKNKLGELNTRMYTLPEKWRRESVLTMKKELAAAMLESVSQVIETKLLGQHTFQNGSHPLDKAILPLKPKKTHLFIYSFLAAFFGGISYYFFAFCKALYRGFPLSPEMLKLLGLHCSGVLSADCANGIGQMKERDLETLRRMTGLLKRREKGVVIACIGGKHFDYSQSLVELIGMRGLKPLLVKCNWDPLDRSPGFWQHLEEPTEALPIQHFAIYDLLVTGGLFYYGYEIFQGTKFHTLLETLQSSYDVILLYSNIDPCKMEATALLPHAEIALITVQNETKEAIEVYTTWAEQKQNAFLSLIYAEPSTYGV